MREKISKNSEGSRYDHSKIEKKWQKKWQKNKIYRTENNTKKEKFYVLDMFPYPSGEGLHVGHPKGYIATDVVSRMKRMQGFNVLHPMGFDAFGLPAEQYAIKMKVNPAVAVAKNVAHYKKQLEIIGFDYDWSREVVTTDPRFYKWTQWIFLRLLEKGLAFEAEEPINWCPVDKTGLANEDVENGRCERCGALVEKKLMRQWVLRITDYADRLLYDLDAKDSNGKPILDWPESIKEAQRNWIGRSEGAEIDFTVSPEKKNFPIITVFTSRPDTLFGVTYLVLAPEHPSIDILIDASSNPSDISAYVRSVRNKTEIDRTDATKEKTGVELKGIKAIHPATGEKIPIWVADYVLSDYGTGAIMAVPAHDERDHAFAKKYKLPIKTVAAEFFEDQVSKRIPGEKMVERDVVHVILFNKNKEVLCLDWKEHDWKTFIIGGIEKGESPEAAALREIREETGYKNVKVKKIAGYTVSAFYAVHKKENRVAYATVVECELENDEQDTISEEEAKISLLQWIPVKSVHEFVNLSSQKTAWELVRANRPFTGRGIVLDSGKFSKLSSEEAGEMITSEFGRKKVTYKLRNWVFSRQRYWGEPIPVLHDEDGGVIPVADKDLPVVLPKVKYYEPTGTGESPLALISKWVNVKLKIKNSKLKILRRETNTMPQWAGSSWYYLRYMDPNDKNQLVSKEAEKYWKEVDLYVGGAEHATRHLIYARFWHKFLFDIGVVSHIEPFRKLQPVGLIMAEDGRKMSKRWGNVINPDDIVKRVGADTLRVYEMFMGPFDQSIAWSTDSMAGARRFLERIWRLQNKIEKKSVSGSRSEIDVLVQKTIKKVGEDISELRFNTAISSMMILLNQLDKEESVRPEHYRTFILLLAPFAPHISEELWARIGNEGSVHKEKWPKFDPVMVQDEFITLAIQVNGKTRATIKAGKDDGEEELVGKAKGLPELKKWLNEGMVTRVIYVKGRIINLIIDENK